MSSRRPPVALRRPTRPAGPLRRRVVGVLGGLLAILATALPAALAVAAGATSAAGTPEATPPRLGERGPVLTVFVLDEAGAVRARRDFDLAALAALPPRTLVANTPWYGATHRFTGPLLRDVLAAAGATGRRLTAIALNDYRVDIPVDDAERWPVIVALEVDERPVAVRDKGPLMVMYPFDDDHSLRHARYYGRAVWQLRTLEVR